MPREAKEVVPQPVVSIAIFLESREQKTSSCCARGAEKNRVCTPAEHEHKRFCLGGRIKVTGICPNRAKSNNFSTQPKHKVGDFITRILLRGKKSRDFGLRLSRFDQVFCLREAAKKRTSALEVTKDEKSEGKKPQKATERPLLAKDCCFCKR